MARATEEHAGEIVAAYLAAGVERGDWRALDALVTRVYGKPVERVETVQADPLGIAAMSPDERAKLLQAALAQHPHLAALIPAHGAHLVQH
jgi:hypothetical protein